MAGRPEPKVMGPIKRDENPDKRLSARTWGSGWMYAVTKDVPAETSVTPIA